MKLPNNKAFTLIELTIVAGIVALLSMLLTMVISRSLVSYRFNQQAIIMQDSAAKALRDFENKTRGAEQILVADSDELSFYAYIAGDIRPAPSKIRFFYQDGLLQRGIISPSGEGPNYTYPDDSETITTQARGLLSDEIFSFYSSDNYNYNDDLTTRLGFPVPLSDIKLVRISLSIDFDINKPPVASEESTLVNLRNLKRNL